MENFQIIRTLGEGTYGRALLCKRKSDQANFVIKEVNLQNMSDEEKKEAENEVSILSLLKHPNIVCYNNSFTQRNRLYIVQEFADGGDLSDRIEKQKGIPMTEEQIMNYFIQITIALKYLHEHKIMHRDLKSQNVFLMKNDFVKLGDFGISKQLENSKQLCQTQIGTPFYLSPELCEGKKIWSCK